MTGALRSSASTGRRDVFGPTGGAIRQSVDTVGDGNFGPFTNITALPMTPQFLRVGATPFVHSHNTYIDLFVTFYDGQIQESVYRY